jgi:transposase
MKGIQNKKKVDYTGQTLYVGLDDHLKSLKVAIYNEELFLKTFSQDKDVSGLIHHLLSHYPGATLKSVYEMGFSGFSLHRALVSAGIDNIVVSPGDVPSSDKQRRRKSDTVDCHKLGRQLRSGDLDQLYVPSVEAIYDRQLVRLRSRVLNKEHSRAVTRLKMFAYFTDSRIPWTELQGRLSKQKLSVLTSLDLGSTAGNALLAAYVSYIEQFRHWRGQVDRQIIQLAHSQKYKALVALLRTIPGFGLLCSMIFLTEIIDMRRFETLDHLVGYVGLVPDTDSTGEREVCKGLTRRCNANLRWALGQAAWIAIRKDPALTQAYSRYGQRMAKNQAIIRIQKKLLSRVRRVWLHREPYQLGLA